MVCASSACAPDVDQSSTFGKKMTIRSIIAFKRIIENMKFCACVTRYISFFFFNVLSIHFFFALFTLLHSFIFQSYEKIISTMSYYHFSPLKLPAAIENRTHNLMLWASWSIADHVNYYYCKPTTYCLGYCRGDCQVVSVTACSVKGHVFEPSMNAGFQCNVRSLHRPTFYDLITGPTEFIISIVNLVKIVNMP